MSRISCRECNKKLCAAKVPIFENLSCDELEEIVKKINHRVYKKNDIVFSEGNQANTLYFVNEGNIKLYKYNKDGKEQILHMLSDGDFFGELDLVKISEYKFNAKAIKDTKICSLKNDEMKTIINKKPEIAIKFLESLGQRLSAIENLAQNLSTNDIDARIAYLLINLMDKHLEVSDGVKSIKLPISREDMANYIGVTRETISRKLRKFEDENLIKVIGTKKILILDEDGLKNYI